MLLTFVCIYILISAGIGFYVSTKVKNTRDFAIAGRHLPLPVVIATVFATWFGAEAIFGISSTFVNGAAASHSLGARFFCLLLLHVHGTWR